MKKLVLLLVSATVFVAIGVPTVGAQSNRVYRCGNVYTNNPPAGQKDCKPVNGGNVTVVPSVHQSESSRAATLNQAAKGLEDERLRQRSVENRQTLQTELRKAQAAQDELLKQFNNGEPEKMVLEFRNHQRYVDRVADLKGDIDRNASRIDDLRRELDNLSGSEPK